MKINPNDIQDLDQLEEYGVKIKNRYKVKKLPKSKFNRQLDKKSQSKTKRVQSPKYSEI